MKLLIYCLTFSTILSGYSNNDYYVLDLGFANNYTQSFSRLDFHSSAHVEVLKAIKNESVQCNSQWETREAILKQNGLYDTFCDAYKKLCIEIKSLVCTLRSAEPGELTLIQQAGILVSLSKFASISATVSQAAIISVEQLIPYWFNEVGQLKVTAPPVWYNAFGHIENWWSSKKYDQFVSNLEDQLMQWSSRAGLIECADNVIYTHQVRMSNSSPLCQVADIKDLRAIDDFCEKNEFENAYQIVQKYEVRFAKNHQDNFFQKTYADKFCQKFDLRGIDKRYLNDPIIETLNLTARATPSPHNAILEKRYNAKYELLKACSVTNPSAQLEAFVYDILDNYMSNNFQGMIDKASQILNSSPELYSQLVDHKNGTFKFIKLNPQISNAQFPSSIHRADNAELRTVVNKLGLVNTQSPVTQSQVKQALEYVKHALNNAGQASRYFASRISDSLEKGIDDPVLHLPDFCSKISDAVEDSLREKVSEYIAGKLKNYDQCADIYIRKSVQGYQSMVSGDSNAVILLEKTFGQTTHENILLIDVEQLKSKVVEVNEDFNAIFDRLADAYKDVAAYGLVSNEIYTPTDAATRLCLLERGINPLIYERFNGDQIQHVWHQLDVKALHVGGHLSLQEMPLGAKQILEFGLQSNFVVNAFIKAKDFGNVLNSTCAALVSYNYVARLSQICDAADLGLKTAENTLIHVAQYPIEAAISVGKGLVNLALMVDNQARKFSEISHNAIFSPEKAQAQLAEHKAVISALTHEIIETIEQKGIEGCVQDVTQFVAESVVLGCVAKTSKAASIVGLEKIKPLEKLAKNEVIIARTTAGTLEKLSRKVGPEICVMKDSGQIQSNKFLDKFGTSIKESSAFRLAEKTIVDKQSVFEKINLKPVSKSALKHIINGHSIDGVKAKLSNKSIFYKSENIIDLVLQGWEKGTFVDEHTKIFDFGRAIGIDLNGNPTAMIKIVLNETKDSIKTAFPS